MFYLEFYLRILVCISLLIQVTSVELRVKKKDCKILLCSPLYKINFSEWRAGKTVPHKSLQAVQDINLK